jgi:hypothetical protein
MPNGEKAWRVMIRYREPTYERHAGDNIKLFHFTYRISATSADAATKIARAVFHETTHLSNVGWRREILDITCRELRASQPPDLA